MTNQERLDCFDPKTTQERQLYEENEMEKTKVEIFADQLMQEFLKNGQNEAENKFILIIEKNKLPLWAQVAIMKDFAKLREDHKEIKERVNQKIKSDYLLQGISPEGVNQLFEIERKKLKKEKK